MAMAQNESFGNLKWMEPCFSYSRRQVSILLGLKEVEETTIAVY